MCSGHRPSPALGWACSCHQGMGGYLLAKPLPVGAAHEPQVPGGRTALVPCAALLRVSSGQGGADFPLSALGPGMLTPLKAPPGEEDIDPPPPKGFRCQVIQATSDKL